MNTLSDSSEQTGSVSETSPHRTGFVAIIGQPNVGKSTLMNALLRQRLSIVTPKPQTTRQRVLGILTELDYQIIFMDTPGLLQPGYKLQEYMLQSAVHTIRDSEVAVAMVDSTKGLKDLDNATLHHLKQSPGPVILAINKIDRIPKLSILPLIEEAYRRFSFNEIVPISALQDDGLDRLLSAIVKVLPEGPALYPDDMLTDQPERFFAAEIIREHLFLAMRDELPYASAVQIEDFKERPNGVAYIQASIIIEKSSQKGMIIGKKGQMLKRIGSAARVAIAAFLDRPVYLDLWVKIRPTWRKKEQELKRLGYGSM